MITHRYKVIIIMSEIKVVFENFQTFTDGDRGHIIDWTVTLGQNEKSSTCEIVLADPDHAIADRLVAHAAKSGGIQSLPGTTVASVPDIGNAGTTGASQAGTVPLSNTNGIVTRGAGFTPQVLAFADLVALKEVGGYFQLGDEKQYYVMLGGRLVTKEETAKGFPTSQGTKAVGRYQFHLRDWVHYQKDHPGTIKDFSPRSQDIMYLWKMKYRKAIEPLMAGNIREAITRAGKEWASLPGSPYGQVQKGWTYDQAIAYYYERLKYYQAETGQVQTVAPTQKTEPPAPKAALSPQAVAPVEPIIKGNRIIVTLQGQYEYVFYHQGTRTSEDGKTVVSGQGIRWVLNRRKRNKTVKDVTLRGLAEQVSKAHGLRLDYQANINPSFEHIDQSGISDYSLLLREASQAGLFVSESADGKTLTIKNRTNVKDTRFIISPRANLIAYTIEDRALGSAGEEASSLLQEETKAEVDPLTGQLRAKNVDIDPAKDKSATGDNKSAIAGIPNPGQDATMVQNRARTKRIKGLPSSFEVLSDYTMNGVHPYQIQPLDAVRTVGLKGTFNRVWMVDQVTHKADGKTTLVCYSPIDVIDNTPPATSVAPAATAATDTPQPAQNINVPTGTWVYPTSGVITSTYKWRWGKMHRGLDIAGGNVPVYAIQGGVVTQANDGCAIGATKCGGGYGNFVEIVHPNGARSFYGHLVQGSIKVRSGQHVRSGDVIATQGTTGFSTGVHLHFEYRLPRKGAVHPGDYLDPKFRGEKDRSYKGGSPMPVQKV